MKNKPLNALGSQVKEQLIKRFLDRKTQTSSEPEAATALWLRAPDVPDAYTRFDRHPGYLKLMAPVVAAQKLGLKNPFFRCHDAVAGATTSIANRQYINFANYNYLGLNGHPRVNKAARDAVERYGTSASASRIVGGERQIQRELEQSLAELYDVDDCVVFVSGHATNVTTIGYLFGPKDLVVHDSLIHNSMLEGIKLSGATRRPFPHNDMAALEGLLANHRRQFERVLIAVEGVYSMDGDVADLPRLVDIKTRYKAFLMVDEAHSLGILGQHGKGLREHFGVAGRQVDIWMGTLSKALAGCGGYIAGERALVDHLKYAAPGFVFSVGIPPPMAAASLEALRIMLEEPERVARLGERSSLFLQQAREAGIDTGKSQGFAIVPAIIGSSLKASRLSNRLFEHGINVQPMIYPAVEERAARLRFFLCAQHQEEQIVAAVQALRKLV